MRIGDAAAAAGTTPRALRFYEASGLLSPPRRTSTGQRVYGPRDVSRIRVIRELLSLGLTVADVRACADRLELIEGDSLPPYGGPGPCGRPTGIVQRRIDALDAEIARLTAVRDRLAGRIGQARSAVSPGRAEMGDGTEETLGVRANMFVGDGPQPDGPGAGECPADADRRQRTARVGQDDTRA
jgi:DNA-binding transcriptional MerR regulator